MVFKDNCTQVIMKEFPEFGRSQTWKQHLEFWGEDKAALANEIATFGDFVVYEILNSENPVINPVRIFQFAEKLMVEGDETVQTLIATCFLENIINYESYGDVKASSFVHLLGPESKDYCKGWDEFTGVKTEGLWD